MKIIYIYIKLAFGNDVSMTDVPASHVCFLERLSLRNSMNFNRPRDVANKGLTPKTFADLRRAAREASQSAVCVWDVWVVNQGVWCSVLSSFLGQGLTDLAGT